jgi:hypothetical protein
VTPLTVVEDLKVLEDRIGELETGVLSLVVQELDQHPRPERLHLAVVVAVTDRAHRLGQARVQRPTGEHPRGQLGAVIGVNDHAFSLPILDRDPKRVHDQRRGL